MAGPRRSKRLQSCSKPHQDRVTKTARVSNDQETMEKVVQGENKKSLDPGVDRPSPKDTSTEDVASNDVSTECASSEDASPNRASEEALGGELRGEELLKDVKEKHDRDLAEELKCWKEGLVKFRQDVQWPVGLGYRQFELSSQWAELYGRIQVFIDRAGFGDLPWDRLEKAVQQKFTGYSPYAEQLFEIRPVRQFMFERWIWEIIDENIFTTKSQDIEWTSPYWEAQATMERFLREKHFDYDNDKLSCQYANWRFTTINFYYTLNEPITRTGTWTKETRIEPECVAKILKKALGQYFPKNPGPAFERLISGLTNIIAEFELLFYCGRQNLRLVFHDPNTKEACEFPFSARAEGFNNQVVMRSVGPEDEDEPMLVSYGHPDGWDYHVPRVSKPLRVCVGYFSGCEQDEVIETEENGEGDGEEEVKIIKDEEGGAKHEDKKKIEDEHKE
ncbi:hypothetical protein FPCIR_10089 [Fusarium pseudocircinatum]|uniref:Uncharacterized protein n=1 Tax=Fusarium pseudocircinatum TaxID=56676 RepID=A0A8H5KVT3_9HYPO|nr:hypothetical protein FPCIR_10089 [Fusarium pseudocircinatum]